MALPQNNLEEHLKKFQQEKAIATGILPSKAKLQTKKSSFTFKRTDGAATKNFTSATPNAPESSVGPLLPRTSIPSCITPKFVPLKTKPVATIAPNRNNQDKRPANTKQQSTINSLFSKTKESAGRVPEKFDDDDFELETNNFSPIGRRKRSPTNLSHPKNKHQLLQHKALPSKSAEVHLVDGSDDDTDSDVIRRSSSRRNLLIIDDEDDDDDDDDVDLSTNADLRELGLHSLTQSDADVSDCVAMNDDPVSPPRPLPVLNRRSHHHDGDIRTHQAADTSMRDLQESPLTLPRRAHGHSSRSPIGGTVNWPTPVTVTTPRPVPVTMTPSRAPVSITPGRAPVTMTPSRAPVTMTPSRAPVAMTPGTSPDNVRLVHYHVMTQICDIIQNIPTAKLQAASGVNYGKLQDLIDQRKELALSTSDLSVENLVQTGHDTSYMQHSTPYNTKPTALTPRQAATRRHPPPAAVASSPPLPPGGESFYVNVATTPLSKPSATSSPGVSLMSPPPVYRTESKFSFKRPSLPTDGRKSVDSIRSYAPLAPPAHNSMNQSAIKTSVKDRKSPSDRRPGLMKLPISSRAKTPSPVKMTNCDISPLDSPELVIKPAKTTIRKSKSSVIQTQVQIDDIEDDIDDDLQEAILESNYPALDDIPIIAYTPREPKRVSASKALSYTQFTQVPNSQPGEQEEKFVPLTHRQAAGSSSASQPPQQMHRDDGATSEFSGFEFDHSVDMLKAFKNVFGLKNFRKNQQQAVNATMLGHDCFILMPTGGGKSLCYQLPAVISPGVTIVVSPLRSLIMDQVQKLCSINIGASHLSSDVSVSQADVIYQQLHLRQPDIKLLYVTPEKLSASEKLLSALQHLYSRDLLARLVIDEAHCVSQWGHDFRPDYKKLYVLREKFPGVPMLALTATATPRVRTDILHQLRMRSPKWFMQSFNRRNLKYLVSPKKPKSLISDIANLINQKFRNKSGIIYCLSRNECDTVAATLKSAKIQAAAYHAGLTDLQRASVQTQWLNEEKCKVVCATIAFGMGIDKPDVRFVIHYSLPKSMEGYYQESGRGGRDGLPSTCILYYSYSDVARLRRMIETDANAPWEAKKVHLDNLYRMVHYCENKTDCRRAQQMAYFGEFFDKKECNNMRGASCDICESEDKFEVRDITQTVIPILSSVKQVSGGRNGTYTLIYFLDVFKGSKNQKILDNRHNKLPMYGLGSSFNKADCERLMRKLVLDGLLRESLVITAMDHAACYISLADKAQQVLSGKLRVQFSVRVTNVPESGRALGAEPETVARTAALTDQCYEELVQLARDIAVRFNFKSYANIFSTDTLRLMAERLPITKEEMVELDGFPPYKYAQYGGEQFLDVTQKYTALLSSLEEDEPFQTTSHNLPLDIPDPSFEPNQSHYFNHASSSKRKGNFSKFRGGFKRKKSARGNFKAKRARAQ